MAEAGSRDGGGGGKCLEDTRWLAGEYIADYVGIEDVGWDVEERGPNEQTPGNILGWVKCRGSFGAGRLRCKDPSPRETGPVLNGVSGEDEDRLVATVATSGGARRDKPFMIPFNIPVETPIEYANPTMEECAEHTDYARRDPGDGEAQDRESDRLYECVTDVAQKVVVEGLAGCSFRPDMTVYTRPGSECDEYKRGARRALRRVPSKTSNFRMKRKYMGRRVDIPPGAKRIRSKSTE